MGDCYIIGAGDFCENALDVKDDDFVIAADGGYRYLDKIGIKPDLYMGDFDSGYTFRWVASTPFSFRKLMMFLPTRSLPVSLIILAFTPHRPSDTIALNELPPGTALMGCSSLKIMSSTVSPIPITFRILF